MTVAEVFDTYFHTINKDPEPRYETEYRFIQSLHTQYSIFGSLTDRQIYFLWVITFAHEDSRYDYIH